MMVLNDWQSSRVYRLAAVCGLLLFALTNTPARAVDGVPVSLSTAVYQARALLQRNRPQQAVRVLNRVRTQPRGPRQRGSFYFLYGVAQWRSGATNAAVNSLNIALNQQVLPDATEARVRYALAQVLVSMERRDEAIPLLEQALCCLSNQAADARLLLADLYTREKSYGKALVQLEGLSRQFEQLRKRKLVHQMLARAYMQRGQVKHAVPQLQVLLGYSPERREYWLGLAKAQIRLGDIGAAMKVLDSAYQQGYLTTDADLYLLASVTQHEGEALKAATLLEKELEAGRMQPSGRNLALLSVAWRDAGDWGRALPPLEEHLALAMPVEGELVRHLVNIQLERSDWCGALVSLDWLLPRTKDADKGRVLFQTGRVHFEMGDLQQARANFLLATGYPEQQQQAQQWLERVRLAAEGEAGELPE